LHLNFDPLQQILKVRALQKQLQIHKLHLATLCSKKKKKLEKKKKKKKKKEKLTKMSPNIFADSGFETKTWGFNPESSTSTITLNFSFNLGCIIQWPKIK